MSLASLAGRVATQSKPEKEMWAQVLGAGLPGYLLLSARIGRLREQSASENHFFSLPRIQTSKNRSRAAALEP